MSLIKLDNIVKVYGKDEGKTEALKGVSLEIKMGELVAIMGASGSGKSTLLNILGCLDRQSSGEYYLEGKEISNLDKNKLASLRGSFFGFIVQYFALIDDYTIYQNVRIPLDYTNLSKKEKDKRIMEMLKKLHIENKKSKLPSQISGGQSQRVAIARALVNNPQVVLADEPTGALDKNTGEEVMGILKGINHEGKTVIIVTHDDSVAAQCKRIIKIEDGKIISDRINDATN